MSSAGFDILRAEHPDQTAVIGELESAIRLTLLRDPNALVDDEILERQLGALAELLDDLLIELVINGTLVPVAIWMCPEGRGAVREALHVKDLPDVSECERCGKQHQLRRRDIEFKFLPSEGFKAVLTRETPQ